MFRILFGLVAVIITAMVFTQKPGGFLVEDQPALSQVFVAVNEDEGDFYDVWINPATPGERVLVNIEVTPAGEEVRQRLAEMFSQEGLVRVTDRKYLKNLPDTEVAGLYVKQFFGPKKDSNVIKSHICTFTKGSLPSSLARLEGIFEVLASM